MKKIIAVLLSFVVFCSTAGCLTGCSDSENQIRFGQWLQMVNTSFGMQSYTTEEPYFSNITSQNEFFETVQIAGDWEVIDTTQETFDTDKVVTYKMALVSLMNAGNFISVDASDDDKVDAALSTWAEKIKKYVINWNLTSADASDLLGKAQEAWAEKTYDENIQNVDYKENVVNLSNEKFEYKIEGDTVVLDEKYAENVVEDSVYVLPQNDSNTQVTAHRAKKIYTEEGKTYIENDDNLELTDVAENLKLQQTYAPTMDDIVLYDADGNVISAGSNTNINNMMSGAASDAEQPEAMNYTSDNKEIFNCAGSKLIDNMGVSLSANSDGIKAEVNTKLASTSDNRVSMSLKAGISLSDLKVTNDVDMSFFKLNSATVKLDYKRKTSFGTSLKADILHGVAAPSYSNGNGKFLTNFKRSVLKDYYDKGAKTIASKKIIKIGSIDIVNGGLGKVCLDINLTLGFSGSSEIVFTETGSKGIEYKNKNVRFINSTHNDTDVQIKASLEALISVGPALYVIGLKKSIVGFSISGGVGAKASLTIHLVDSDNHLIEENTSSDLPPELSDELKTYDLQAEPSAIEEIAKAQGGKYQTNESTVKLHIDNCIDICAYGILKIGISDNSFIGSLLNGKIKTEISFFDASNAKFLNIHIENMDFEKGFQSFAFGEKAQKNQCTLKYTPFDKDEQATTVNDDNTGSSENSSIIGDTFILENIEHVLVPGDTIQLKIATIPKAYKESDVTYVSADNSIATVDNNGKVTAVSSGATLITAMTKDGVYSADCAVLIVDDNSVEFNGISYVLPSEKNRNNYFYI